jgi:SAM-dependent methyltransferase
MIPAGARSLLDIGTGNGAFLKHLEQSGSTLELAGIERSEMAARMRWCRTKIVIGSADALPYPDRSFDIVSACEVIEHLPFGVYETALAEMSRTARSHILVSVPFREKRTFMKCPYCETEFPAWFHLRSFDLEKLSGLFAGFRMVSNAKVTAVARLFLLSPDPRDFWAWLRRARAPIWAGQVCPTCSFTPAQRPRASAASSGLDRRPLRSRFKTWVSLSPKGLKEKWVIALYSRTP